MMEKQTYSRRFFLTTSSLLATFAFIPDSVKAFYTNVKKLVIRPKEELRILVTINKKKYKVNADSRTTLLDLVREQLQLTGTKKGCDHGQCGACTVLVNGERINSCLTLAVSHDGESIT